MAKYDFNIIPELKISTQIQYDNNNKLNSGLFLAYQNFLEFGFIYKIQKSNYYRDNVDYMLSGSVKLTDNIQFITYFNPYFVKTHIEGEGWNLYGQLRINIE
jgi:hypothetical protein